MRSDLAWMQQALALARRALGTTAPNPSVGCVLVREGHLIGYGHTQAGGRPHAETVALAMARASDADLARGAVAYVTLEPCSHHGRTPPCAEALIASGVARVVVALRDPDPRVNGRGIAMLKRAGLVVEEGLCAAEASEINAGFLLRQREGRPIFVLKLATSLDGRIAMANGESRWITSAAARARGHLLRATHDAILIGIGTALADDPDLGCRLPGMGGHSPVRLVLDSRARLPLESRLVQTAGAQPVWLLVGPTADTARIEQLQSSGVRIVRVPIGANGAIDLGDAARTLGLLGLTRVLIEGGARVSAGFVARGLVDRIETFRSGLLLGADGLAALGPLGLPNLAAAPHMRALDGVPIGEDRGESWVRPTAGES